MIPSFHKLKYLEPSTIWLTEDRHFTPWLAEEENLARLGDAINMNLEFETRERKVGSFFADIVCKNKSDNTRVVIENQLYSTDHDHLGKVITYGAGLDAITMIWVASKFRKEHRNALKWLNEITDKKFEFFGIEIKVCRIVNDDIAVEFNVVSSPNDWHKPSSSGMQKKNKGALTPLQVLKKRYWQGLEKYMADNGSKLTGQTPGPWQSQYFNIGKAGTGIKAIVNTKTNKVRVEVNFDFKETCKAFFNLLHKDKKIIESEFGFNLDWQEFPEKGYSSIGVNIKNMDINDAENWEMQYKGIKNTIEKLDKVFTYRIRNINPKDWDPTAPK